MSYSFETWKNDIDKLYGSLDLKRSAVGVRFIKTKEEYEGIEAISIEKPITYCRMVLAATRGNIIKARDESFGCRSGARVFGINPEDEKNGNGQNWVRLGMYKDMEVSSTVRGELAYSKENCFGVVLGPIERLSTIPDVVLMVTNPYNSMRITQGYAYHYGMPKSVNMIGNQALCLECTARPYVIQDLNLSLLCIGTRHKAKWGDDEMAAGIPIEQFHNVVDGVFNTINIMEDNTNKSRIEKAFKDRKIPHSMRFDYNYYMDV